MPVSPRARPLLLDLFCGAGGAAMGYYRAGFNIVGVDINPQPNYPFEFVQDDALDYLQYRLGFDAIHASPPCQDYSRLTKGFRLKHGTGYLLVATRELLKAASIPWVIENVPGASMRADYKLCGCMFGLPGLRRERWFETSWRAFDFRSPCSHSDETVTVTGHPGGSSKRDGRRGFGNTEAWKQAMGIDWMTATEMAQAIPPAYTQHIAAQLLTEIEVVA